MSYYPVRADHLRYIIICPVLLFLYLGVNAQCTKDSNYYSITLNGLDKNYIISAVIPAKDEVVTLARHSVFSNYVSKFTSQGSIIWSNEYTPNYPFVSWYQLPWYNNTSFTGIAQGLDSSSFIYGYSTEHGRMINNVEDPPAHQVGLFARLDKYGNVMAGKYFGNWRTDYSITSLVQLNNGSILVYLSSTFYPYVSKVICVTMQGDILWGTHLRTNSNVYREITSAPPVMKQLSNGTVVVVNEMKRDLDDTIQYPFTPPIIVPAPLYYFHVFEIDGTTGRVLEETSYQCPPLTNTTGPPEFVPRIKNITELPNGDLSMLGDMYIPQDNLIFYKHYLYTRCPINFITSPNGYFKKMIVYHPTSGSGSLENVVSTNSAGEQTLLCKDSTNQQMVIFKIDQDGALLWSKGFKNSINTPGSVGTALEKQDGKGYFILQSDPESVKFHLDITNALGIDPCAEEPAVVSREIQLWPWFVNKVNFIPEPFDVDFRYSPFNFTRAAHPISQTIDCQYQLTCCKDYIDSLNQHNITLCENESYQLPDNTIVSDSGLYYATMKTQQGCDSILYYNVKILKSPSHLTVSPDTCMEGSPLIELRAVEGYESYVWNGFPTNKNVYVVHSPGSYTVKVENRCGSKTDTIVVFDKCDQPIYFPTAFTPNGDGLNDVLHVPESNLYKLRRLSIYNRWGEIVFSTTMPSSGWDGKVKGILQPTGVYVYYLEMEGFTGKKVDQRGTVVLIR